MTYVRCLNADEKIIEFWEGRNTLSSLNNEFLIGRQKGQTIQERLTPPKWRRHAPGYGLHLLQSPSARKEIRT